MGDCMINKKGMELSMNTIIILAVGLLILFILVFIIINSGKNSENVINSCENKKGVCINAKSCDSNSIKTPFKCANPEDICCISTY